MSPPSADNTCDPAPEGITYATSVSSWLALVDMDLPAERLLVLFEKAVDAIWARAHWSIGTVSLIAILDRAITLGAVQWPPLAKLHVDGVGVYFQDLRNDPDCASASSVRLGMRALLSGILAIIGLLTTDMLTESLREALMQVTLDPGDRSQPRQWTTASESAEGSDAP
jgi:hypothetical protein